MEPVPSHLEKRYPARGPLQQFRFREPTAFSCFRCGTSKTSKLITIYGGDWSKRLCNGCYGRLLSIYDVKAGAKPDEAAAELLADALLGLLGKQEQRQAEQRLATKESRAKLLSTAAFRFLATAEHVAASLDGIEALEWSPALIGLCKALEIELVERVMRPLALSCSGQNLSSDIGDRTVARVARFCAAPDRQPPPELGSIAHFLRVLENQDVRTNSITGRAFLALTRNWTGSDWILSTTGLQAGLATLTREFRNRAAHIDELSKLDYDRCRDLVIGQDGLLWRLLVATVVH